MTVDRLEVLLSAQGRALLERLSREEPVVADSIRLGSSLREQFSPELVAATLTQHELRRMAEGKFSKARRMLFTRPGLEQASAEVVSRYRAPRFAGRGRLADLCTGIGGDLISIAGQGETMAVDLDEVHLRMAVLNAEVYGVAAGVRAVLADVRSVDLAGIGGVFIDPARRSGGRRLPTGRSEPPLGWCLSVAQAVPAVGIKLAPGAGPGCRATGLGAGVSRRGTRSERGGRLVPRAGHYVPGGRRSCPVGTLSRPVTAIRWTSARPVGSYSTPTPR